MASSSERPSKRLRVEEEDIDLTNGATIDDEEALRCRLERRNRWKAALKETSRDEDDDDDNEIDAVTARSTFHNTAILSSSATHEEPTHEEVDEAPLVTGKEDDGGDSFDMFSSSVSPVVENNNNTTRATSAAASTTATTKDDDFDDEQGYYKGTIGEMILSRYKVLGIIGKGVFSTVLKCNDSVGGEDVALKLIRNNETMRKASMTELKILRLLGEHPHIVKLLFPLEEKDMQQHHHHVVMSFAYMRYNLRDVLQKFGRGVGISITSIQLYFPQLLSALRHLEKHQVIHADLKPDNILVSGDFSILQVCDFGSATWTVEEPMIPTPYLCSRYYRAPEIMLGLTPTYKVDLWSAAVSMAELFLGKVVFAGNSNNDMMYSFMDLLGSPSPKQIKSHLLQCKTYPGIPAQFQDAHYFLQTTMDKVTEQSLVKLVSTRQFPSRPLQSLLLKAKSSSDDRIKVMQFADLLRKCLHLDPSRRMELKQALQHEFFQKETSNHKTCTS